MVEKEVSNSRVSAEAVKIQLVKKFSMTEQEAQQKLELYWK